MRFLAANTGKTAVKMSQEYVPYVTQSIISAFSEEMKRATWRRLSGW